MNDILRAVKSIVNSGKDHFTIGDIRQICKYESIYSVRKWLENNGGDYGIIHATLELNPEENSYHFRQIPHSEDGQFSYRTKEVKELALQRALISSKCTCGINWIDIELHIDPWLKNDSQRIDIVGYNEVEKKYYVGEIKFYPSNDDLKTTIDQVKDYWKIIKENARVLERSNFHHENACGRFLWTDLNDDNTNLIVISESSFFKSEDFKENLTVPSTMEHPSGVILLNLGEIAEDFFKKQQRRAGSEYEPKLNNRVVKTRDEFLREHHK